MLQKISSPPSFAQRLLKRISQFFAVICMAGCMQASEPAHAVATGIEGTVLWGPLKPGPDVMGQQNEAPLSAPFAVLKDGEKVAEFKSDPRGRFKLALPPGDYTLVPDANIPIKHPTKQTTDVTVPDDGFVTLTVRLDTGMK